MLHSLLSPLTRAGFAACVFVTTTLACAHAGPPASASEEWTPSAEEEAVYKALSARDGAPDCAAVEALAKDPVATLTSVAEHAIMPPWVGIRATHCLATRHAETAQATLSAWVAHPDKRGLALVITDGLGQMPEAAAVAIARSGLAGPHAADLRERLERANVTPAVRAVLTETTR